MIWSIVLQASQIIFIETSIIAKNAPISQVLGFFLNKSFFWIYSGGHGGGGGHVEVIELHGHG
jgi:hypothetical protein